MIVEDELDRRVGGVSGIEEFEKFNEFAAAVAFPDEGVDVASEQIDPGYQGQGAVAFVLVITHHGRAGARQRRTIRLGRADRLNTGLLVIGDDGLATRPFSMPVSSFLSNTLWKVTSG